MLLSAHFWQFWFLFLEFDLENELRGRNVIRNDLELAHRLETVRGPAGGG